MKMKRKKYQKEWNRILLSILLAFFLMLTNDFVQAEKSSTLAWWGTLYPRFCFGKTIEIAQTESEEKTLRPKISFYLAKLFER